MTLNFSLHYDKLFFNINFFKNILMRNKTIDSFFKNDRREVVGEDENKINFTSLHILKYYTNDQIVQLDKLFFEVLY